MTRRSRKKVKKEHHFKLLSVVGIIFAISLTYISVYEKEYDKFLEAQQSVILSQTDLRENINDLLLQVNEIDDNRFEFIKLVISSVEYPVYSSEYEFFASAYVKFRKSSRVVVHQALNQKEFNDVLVVTDKYCKEFYQYNNSLTPFADDLSRQNCKAGLAVIKELEINMNEMQISLHDYFKKVEAYNHTIHASPIATHCATRLGLEEIPLPEL